MPRRRLEVEEIAARAPIQRPEDFMGKEHFRVFGERAGEHPRNSGVVFNALLDPKLYVPYSRPSRDLALRRYAERGIVVHKRADDGLEPLPDFMSQPDTRSTASLAMMAKSVIYLANNPNVLTGFKELVDETGYPFWSMHTLRLIAEEAHKEINTNTIQNAE